MTNDTMNRNPSWTKETLCEFAVNFSPHKSAWLRPERRLSGWVKKPERKLRCLNIPPQVWECRYLHKVEPSLCS